MRCRYAFSALLSLLVLLTVFPAQAQSDGPASPGIGVNFETRLTALEDQMRSLNGQLEQLNFSLRRLDQNLQRLQSDNDARLSKLESAETTAASSVAAPLPASPAAPEAPVNGSLGAVKIQDGKVTGGINNPKAPPLPDAPPDYGLTPQEQYDRAFGLLRQADYDEAEKAFKTFIDKNPKDKLIDNAKYWYGETLYVRGRFDESAVAFADAFQQNPQGTKAPDSLLKLAMTLDALQKNADACTTLGELRNKYPNASASVKNRADEERQKLRCGSAR